MLGAARKWADSKAEQRRAVPASRKTRKGRLTEAGLYVRLADVVSRKKSAGLPQKFVSLAGRWDEGLGQVRNRTQGWTGKTPKPCMWLLGKVMNGLPGTGLLRVEQDQRGASWPSAFSDEVHLVPEP